MRRIWMTTGGLEDEDECSGEIPRDSDGSNYVENLWIMTGLVHLYQESGLNLIFVAEDYSAISTRRRINQLHW